MCTQLTLEYKYIFQGPKAIRRFLSHRIGSARMPQFLRPQGAKSGSTTACIDIAGWCDAVVRDAIQRRIECHKLEIGWNCTGLSCLAYGSLIYLGAVNAYDKWDIGACIRWTARKAYQIWQTTQVLQLWYTAKAWDRNLWLAGR